jgi:predicted regulator of Ras-like GTPase activity (Roadblock/LC7/MglB family)
MRTEFGRAMEDLMEVPGSMGAVLVDDDGYAIDYVHDAAVLAELDVQLLGAQLGQIVARTQTSADKHQLGGVAVVVMGELGSFIAGPVGVDYVLAFLLCREASADHGLRRFETVRDIVAKLLG